MGGKGGANNKNNSPKGGGGGSSLGFGGYSLIIHSVCLVYGFLIVFTELIHQNNLLNCFLENIIKQEMKV